jgi:hypothetical protein
MSLTNEETDSDNKVDPDPGDKVVCNLTFFAVAAANFWSSSSRSRFLANDRRPTLGAGVPLVTPLAALEEVRILLALSWEAAAATAASSSSSTSTSS